MEWTNEHFEIIIETARHLGKCVFWGLLAIAFGNMFRK